MVPRCRSIGLLTFLLAACTLLLALSFTGSLAFVVGGTLDPTTIPKYVEPMQIPPAMPMTGTIGKSVDYYEIAARQFLQQVLPGGMP